MWLKYSHTEPRRSVHSVVLFHNTKKRSLQYVQSRHCYLKMATRWVIKQKQQPLCCRVRVKELHLSHKTSLVTSIYCSVQNSQMWKQLRERSKPELRFLHCCAAKYMLWMPTSTQILTPKHAYYIHHTDAHSVFCIAATLSAHTQIDGLMFIVLMCPIRSNPTRSARQAENRNVCGGMFSLWALKSFSGKLMCALPV